MQKQEARRRYVPCLAAAAVASAVAAAFPTGLDLPGTGMPARSARCLLDVL